MPFVMDKSKSKNGALLSVKSGRSIVYIEWSQDIIFLKKVFKIQIKMLLQLPSNRPGLDTCYSWQ